jgi:hypothetical protein
MNFGAGTAGSAGSPAPVGAIDGAIRANGGSGMPGVEDGATPEGGRTFVFPPGSGGTGVSGPLEPGMAGKMGSPGRTGIATALLRSSGFGNAGEGGTSGGAGSMIASLDGGGTGGVNAAGVTSGGASGTTGGVVVTGGTGGMAGTVGRGGGSGTAIVGSGILGGTGLPTVGGLTGSLCLGGASSSVLAVSAAAWSSDGGGDFAIRQPATTANPSSPHNNVTRIKVRM